MIYTLDEIDLDVSYTVNWGYEATREEPGEPAHIDFLEVRLAGHDITAFLRDSILMEIEDACMEDASAAKRDYFNEPDPEY